MSSVQPVVGTRHEYRVRGAQVYPIVAAVAVGVLVPVSFAIGGISSALSVGAVGLAIAGLVLLYCQRTRLTIEGSQLTVQSLLQVRAVDLSEIAGIRTYRSRYGSYRVICLKSGRNPIQVSRYSVDDAFRAWLSQIPDLDQKDREAVLEQISQDQELGATPEERLEALARAKQINIGACVVAGAAAAGYLWGQTAWRLPCYVVLLLAPVAALMLLLRSPLLYALFKRRSDPRAEVSVLLFIAGFGLFFRAVGTNFVEESGLLRDMVLVAVAFVLAFYRAARASGQFGRVVFSLCLVSLFFGWGAVVGADMIQDPTPAQVYPVSVMGKHISRGSRSSTYYLRLEPWGPFADENSMKVSPSRYAATNEGDRICVALHPGLLHAAWFEPVECGRSGE